MNESALKNRVLKRLAKYGGLWKKTWGGPYAQSGVFDIIGCLDGMFIAIELKAPGRYAEAKKGMTPAQWQYYSQVKANGGIVIVADDEEQLFTELNEVRIEHKRRTN